MPSRATPRAPLTLAVDIGGSNVKSALVDARGKLASEIIREPTPRPATPAAVLRLMDGQFRQLKRPRRVSIGFPGVIRDGATWTAHNLHPRWVGFPLAATVREKWRLPVRLVNDADMQGLSVVRGRGVELVITLGTGLGSALFVDGRLAPNLEIAHHPFRKNRTYEELLGRAALDRVGAKRWSLRLAEAIAEWKNLFNYDHLYLGGGNTKKLMTELPPDASIVANVNGLLGAPWLWQPR